MSLEISIFGLGYVGSVTAACLAGNGHQIVGVDCNPAKVETMNAGGSPIVEAQMASLIAKGVADGLLRATTDAEQAVLDTDISFICVGTPGLRSGKLDLTYIERVCCEIGQALKRKTSPHVVVLRSTVLPGSTESVVIPILEKSSERQCGPAFTVCYNPEFMREGSAVADFFCPPYTVLGSRGVSDLAPLRDVYRGIAGRTFETSIPTAEMVKYVSNAFHALKVGFANEIGALCKQMDLDTKTVTSIFTSDTRLNISAAYLSPGFAFGGSCLPKDLRALRHRAQEVDLNLPLLDAIMPSNTEHLSRAVETILQTNRSKISVLGLSFKAGTDDLRESPQVQLIKRLLGEGRQVRVWDRDVVLGRLAGSNRHYIDQVIPHIGRLLSDDLEDVVRSGEVVVIGTKSASTEQITAYLDPSQTVVDLVNLDPSQRPQSAASYQGICW